MQRLSLPLTLTSLALCLGAATATRADDLIIWKRIQLSDTFYAEGANYADINKDGHTDIISGPFWYAGPDWQTKHAFYEPQPFSINGYSDNFFTYPFDFNADGWLDILVLGFPGKEARLYLSPGNFSSDTPWEMHIVADVVDNESPVFTDITGDGKPEIVCSTGGKFGWFAPNWSKPTDKWPFVAISDDMKVAKFTHGLGVGDVNGDGKLDLLEARRWWEQPAANSAPGAANWTQHNFAAGVGGGAQMCTYDFDGDGTNDVATALAAHRYGVAVFLQSVKSAQSADAPHWTRRLLVGEHPWENDYGIVFSQPHAMHLADIDGDGVKDLVTGKRYWAHNGHDPDERNARVVYWFQTKRDGKGGVEFVPHLIDAESGVGVDVQVGDVNADNLPDIIVGNKAGVYVLLQQRQQVSKEVAAEAAPKKLYGPALKPQKDYAQGLPPQDALKNLQLPTGFKAELVAAEPEVVQPIAMCWDERGRLWVVEGRSYPKPREPGAGQDRILILEDADGNGSFETKKVFAEGLSLVSGIEVGFGGVWVGAAPYLMFIPDADRDDVPDRSHESYKTYEKVPGLQFTAYTLLDGWGSQDTHETLNSFIWGPDGWLYGCHGVFTHSKIGKPGTPEDQRTPMNAGVWRYHPVRHEFEVFAHGTSNPWGLDYDQNGEFFLTACVIPHLYHIVPGGRYHRQGGQHFNPYTYEDIKTCADHPHYAGDIRDNAHWGPRKEGGAVSNDTSQAGGGHAHCGLAIYQSSQFPATYRNQLIFGNLHGHRLVSDYADVFGSTYVGKHGADLLRSNDMHFVPVTQTVGPDGALYVSDWADKQVCHRGTNAVELWDRSNGRIYRVSYGLEGSADTLVRSKKLGGEAATKDEADKSVRAPLFPRAPFDLTKESDESLVKLAVQTENDWFSRMARRVLMERGRNRPRLPAELARLLMAQTKNANLPVPVQLRALWTVHALRLDTSGWHALEAASPEVRAAAIRMTHPAQAVATLHIMAAKDPSPVVRRELASLLQVLPAEQKKTLATALLKHGEDKDDPMIPLLLWYGIEPVVGADAKGALELAKASRIPKITEFIYRRLGVDETGREALLSIAAETPDLSLRETLLRTVVEAARAGNKVTQPENWGELRGKLKPLGAPPSGGTMPPNGAMPAKAGAPNLEPLLTELEAFMGIEASIASYRNTLSSAAPLHEKLAALKLLTQVRDKATAEVLLGLIQGSGQDARGTEDGQNARPTLRRAAIQALANLPHPDTSKVLLGAFGKLSPAEQIDVINTLATNPAGARALLLAVKDKQVPNSLLTPFVARQMDTLKDAEVKALVKDVWGDLNAPKADLGERKQKFRALLTSDALAKADPAKGKLIFAATCGTCHRMLGEGADVGPDLTGSNRADLDYLFDNVLDPNAVIGKDYQLNIFELADGRLTSGVIKEESAASFRIAMPGGIEQVVPKAEVKKRTQSPVSTMPEGLFDALPAEMLVALVKYLQSSAPNAQAKGLATAAASVDGAIEGESLMAKATGGKTRPQGMGAFHAGRWSGNNHLWWTGAKPGDKLAITFPVAKAGKQKLFGAFTKAPDYGIASLKVDGKPTAIGEIDFFDPAVVNTPELFLGEFDLPTGDHTLEVTLTGANPQAKPAYMFALDYLRIEWAK